MTTRTTSHLILPNPRRWYDLSTPTCAALCILLLLLIGLIVGRVRSGPSVAAVPETAYVFIATPIPTVPTLAPLQVAAAAAAAPAAARYIVGFDSPNGRALGAIPEPLLSAITGRFGDDWLETTHDGAPIWVRAGDLGARLANVAPAPAPQVVYIASQAAPTPAQVVQQAEPTVAAGVDDFYTTPPHVDPAAQQALIGTDPNARACGGSVFCGGLTNAQAQAAINRAHP